MKEINIESIVGNNNLNIIDIRDNYLYNMGCVPKARNIPMNFLITNPDNYLNKEEDLAGYIVRIISGQDELASAEQFTQVKLQEIALNDIEFGIVFMQIYD